MDSIGQTDDLAGEFEDVYRDPVALASRSEFTAVSNENDLLAVLRQSGPHDLRDHVVVGVALAALRVHAALSELRQGAGSAERHGQFSRPSCSRRSFESLESDSSSVSTGTKATMSHRPSTSGPRRRPLWLYCQRS